MMPHIFGARAHDYPGKTPDEHFSAIQSDGMTTMQLAIPKSFGTAYPIPEALLKEIKGALNERDMCVTVLGCYINCASDDEEERLSQVETYVKAMPAAKFLGARCIGTETTRFVGSPEEHKIAMDRLTDSMKRMSDAAEQHDVYIGVEPVASHTLGRAELVPELIRRVGGDRICVIFDPINLIRPEDMADQGAYIRRCKAAFGDKVVAIHVKDFEFDENGRKIEKPLFEGAFDWETFVKEFAGQPLSWIRDEGAAGKNRVEFDRLKQMIAEARA